MTGCRLAASDPRRARAQSKTDLRSRAPFFIKNSSVLENYRRPYTWPHDSANVRRHHSYESPLLFLSSNPQPESRTTKRLQKHTSPSRTSRRDLGFSSCILRSNLHAICIVGAKSVLPGHSQHAFWGFRDTFSGISILGPHCAVLIQIYER